jgi:hypothetical protein
MAKGCGGSVTFGLRRAGESATLEDLWDSSVRTVWHKLSVALNDATSVTIVRDVQDKRGAEWSSGEYQCGS